MDKRTFIKTSALLGLGGLSVAPAFGGKTRTAAPILAETDQFTDANGNYILPELPYDHGALEPHIDRLTLVIHHDKHHAGYVKGVNAATKTIKEKMTQNDFSDIKHWERQLAFNGAGHFLHTLYWNNMAPSGTERSKTLEQYISKSFGSFDTLMNYFAAATGSVEASGWGILAYEPAADKLVILQAEKHQNLSQWLNIPLLVCDVWEHAYYLRYQNNRGEYIKQFMEVINWKKVSERLEAALG